MSDEKVTIYISPEEDLMGVRERLELTPARYITLVFPTETQLRSHVAWKLLRVRVRELGKEVQIVSDSAQVRSVARDVNFKVASSLQDPPRVYNVRPRSSRVGRPSPSQPQIPPIKPGQGFDGDDDLPSLQDPPTQSDEQDRAGPSRVYNVSPRSSRFDRQKSQLPPARPGQGFDSDDDLPFLQDPPTLITPQSKYLDEEPDLWPEDFREAQNVREAASISFPESQSEASSSQKRNELPYPVTEETTPKPVIELGPDLVIPYKTSNAEENDNVIITTSQNNVPVPASLKAVKIFYCYAHQDKPLRDELAKHLHPLIRKRYITEWFDREIQAGMDWRQEIKTQLDVADIILLLISADFISSDYCYNIEMERALERHRAGHAHVIPVILRPAHWEETPLGELQVLPTGNG